MLFIFCGAFTGLDKIIEARLGKKVSSSLHAYLTLEHWVRSQHPTKV
jgi:ATP-dependent protease Clp ATPase subunit